MKDVGDEINFLKRTHVLVEDNVIHIQQNRRHFDKLFEVVGVSSKLKAKKTPCHDLMNEPDDSSLLEPDRASRFRSAIGILLYLANDLPECAYGIRGLSQYMSKPTERSWTLLKHLALCLLEGQFFALQLKIQPDGLWYSPENENGFVLELFSDSDWAAHKASRKSVSAGTILFRGCLLLASSRTQRVIALSSAEAEVHAAVSVTCDGILLRLCIMFCLKTAIRLKLNLDNAAAKQILLRSGVWDAFVIFRVESCGFSRWFVNACLRPQLSQQRRTVRILEPNV